MAATASASAAYEPGSGSTIMAYAGICGAEDLQPHSDPYFHVRSFDEIVSFSTGSGDSCAVKTTTGNGAPTVNAGASYTVPKQTPFTLSGSATDPDADPLTYCWEEFDLGTQAPPNTDLDAARPIFRSFLATTSPSRTFPRLADVLSGSATFGESMSQRTRTMTFRLTARDNRAGGGGVNYAATTVNVNASAGPFAVTQPGTGASWPALSTQTVAWNVASTDIAPVSCANVEITLSTDGGTTFPTTLAASTPNDGSEAVTVPDSQTTTARIEVACLGNVFFDISNPNFTISAPAATLTVGKSGTGLGTVTSVPAGIACGATCAATFPLSTPVELTAVGEPGSRFVGWSGDCSGSQATCQVVMDQARGVTARFVKSAVDYDGDGVSDVLVFNAGSWIRFDYGSGGMVGGWWTGTLAGCRPVMMDYDGDGRDEFTQYCAGAWHFYTHEGAWAKGIWVGNTAGNIPVPGDYDGDGDDDVVIYNNGAWVVFDTVHGGVGRGAESVHGGGGERTDPGADGLGRGRASGVHGVRRRGVVLLQRRREL